MNKIDFNRPRFPNEIFSPPRVRRRIDDENSTTESFEVKLFPLTEMEDEIEENLATFFEEKNIRFDVKLADLGEEIFLEFVAKLIGVFSKKNDKKLLVPAIPVALIDLDILPIERVQDFLKFRERPDSEQIVANSLLKVSLELMRNSLQFIEKEKTDLIKIGLLQAIMCLYEEDLINQKTPTIINDEDINKMGQAFLIHQELEGFQELLKGTNFNFFTSQCADPEKTFLHMVLAVCTNEKSLKNFLKALLDYRNDEMLNYVDSEGNNILMIGVKENNVTLVDFCLENIRFNALFNFSNENLEGQTVEDLVQIYCPREELQDVSSPLLFLQLSKSEQEKRAKIRKSIEVRAAQFRSSHRKLIFD